MEHAERHSNTAEGYTLDMSETKSTVYVERHGNWTENIPFRKNDHTAKFSYKGITRYFIGTEKKKMFKSK